MSYPQYPRSGIPTSLSVSPQTITLALGAMTVQLRPILLDAYGNECSPTAAFQYESSNPSLVSVDANGICTAASSSGAGLQTGGTAEITISYPWSGVDDAGSLIHATVLITVTVPTSTFPAIFVTEDSHGAGTSDAGCWSKLHKAFPA